MSTIARTQAALSPKISPKTYPTEVMETIGTAINDEVCINLKYKDSDRLILPRGVRVSKAGDLLLKAQKWQGDALVHRTYRVDRIQEAQKTALTSAAMLSGPCGIALACTAAEAS